ncbi:MAG: hypothetical protein M1520_00850, partial [Candidatus Marsarchaeota archaeon]|nr:hypothetical protein [Candidatus Marsarchaeota archaeon]
MIKDMQSAYKNMPYSAVIIKYKEMHNSIGNMDKKLKNKTIAVLAGAVIASAAVNCNASERQPLQLEVRTEQSAVQYSANKDYVNPLVDNVIKAKRGEDNFIRTSYTSDAVNLSLSENNGLIASTEYKILYPLLYDQNIGPYVFTAIRDLKYDHFRNATQFLYVASEKAKAENNNLAVDEMNLAYTYIRLGGESEMDNFGNANVNKTSAKALSSTFIQKSQMIYEIAHRDIRSNKVSLKYSQDSQRYNKESNENGLLDIFGVAGGIILMLETPIFIIDGITWTLNKYKSHKKARTDNTQR